MKIAFSLTKSEITFNKVKINIHISKEVKQTAMQAGRNIWLEYF